MSCAATVNYGDGSGPQPLTLTNHGFALGHVYADNGSYTVQVTASDGPGDTGPATLTVTVLNVPPTVGAVTAPQAPVAVNTAVSASASFADPGTRDTHTAVWGWGDGSTSAGHGHREPGGCVPARQNPFSRWTGFDQPGFGAGQQVELTDPGGVGFFWQVLLPCPWVRGSGTTGERPGAGFASGNQKPSSRRVTYSAKASLSMQ
jgi:hypothetical protein